MAAHFAKRNTKFGGGRKRGRAKIPSPQLPSFLPARAFSLARFARHQFRSKKVRISSNKRTRTKTALSIAEGLFLFWCPGWDSNPQPLLAGILSPLRKPFRHPGTKANCFVFVGFAPPRVPAGRIMQIPGLF